MPQKIERQPTPLAHMREESPADNSSMTGTSKTEAVSTGVTDEFSQILSAEPIPGGPEEITQTQPCAGDDFIMTQTAECSQVEEPVAQLMPLCQKPGEPLYHAQHIYAHHLKTVMGRVPGGNADFKTEFDIVLSDKRISSKHCQIRQEKVKHRNKEHESSEFWITDMSANGTWKNGDRLVKGKQYPLKSGDVFSLSTPVTWAQALKHNAWERKAFQCVWQFYNAEEAKLTDTIKSAAPEVINEKYEFTQRVLGNGNFSHVVKCVDRQSGEELAMKVIQVDKFQKFSKTRESDLNIKSEANLLSTLEHPCCVRLHDAVFEPKTAYIIMELCRGGDLLQHILDHGIYDEQVSNRLFIDVCNGLEYLHSRNIVHRDMKPENVLLTCSTPERCRAKISDFGLARSGVEGHLQGTFCGTPHYFAPEMITSHQNGSKKGEYGKEVDAWAAGVILYILLSGIPPFSDDGLYSQIQGAAYDFSDQEWEGVSEDSKDLVAALMKVDIRERFTIRQALMHPWMHRFGNMKSDKRKAGENPTAKRRCTDINMS